MNRCRCGKDFLDNFSPEEGPGLPDNITVEAFAYLLLGENIVCWDQNDWVFLFLPLAVSVIMLFST